MTTDVLHRVVWKEYRVLRAFWLALVLIVIATQAVASTYVEAGQSQRAFYGIMSVAIVLYALGAGAILFAVEREEATDVLLQAFPVQSRQLFTAKFLLGLASSIALAAVLWLVTLAWKWAGLIEQVSVHARNAQQESPGGALAVAAMGLLVFLCGLCCSLLVNRPLFAACLGAFLAFVMTYPALLVSAAAKHFQYGYTDEDVAGVWTLTLFATAACVFAVDVWLGRRWLTSLDFGNRLRRQRSRRIAAVVASPLLRLQPRRSTIAAFGRLLWQDVRQSWRMVFAILGLGTLVCVWIATLSDQAEPRTLIAALVALGTVAIIGAATFLPDQERSQFRFFAERPVRPRMVWLNRQVVWLPVVLVYLLAAVPIWILVVFQKALPFIQRFAAPASHRFDLGIQFTGGLFQMPATCVFFVAAILAYACGQLCSMLFRSGIVAGFMALILTAVVLAWSSLMGAMNVDWLLSVAPLVVIFLGVTWLRAPHWIAERTGWWPWTRLALSLAVPLAGLGAATITYRVLQIPLVDPGFSPAPFAAVVTPAARETAEMYLRANGLVNGSTYPKLPPLMHGRADFLAANLAGMIPGYSDPPVDAQSRQEWLEIRSTAHDLKMLPWLAENQEPLRVALEASERPSCVFPLTPSGIDLSKCEELLGTEAHRRGLAGDLDGMFECELALLRMSVDLRRHQFRSYGWDIERRTLDVLTRWWATRPGQTPERLRHAIKAIQEWESTVPPPTDPVEARFVWISRLLNFDPDALAAEAGQDKYLAQNLGRLVFLSKIMPWEIARARRANNQLTDWELSEARALGHKLIDGKPTSAFARRGRRPLEATIEQSTPLLTMLPYAFWIEPQFMWLEGALRRSSSHILLALSAWRLEHGTLPESLDELVGPYFHELPRDPYSGQNYRYFPHGLAARAEFDFRVGKYTETPPLLWSCSERLTPADIPNQMHEQYYQVMNWWGGTESATGDFLEMMRYGEFIKIPVPKSADAPVTVTPPDEDSSATATPPVPTDEKPGTPAAAAPVPPPDE